MDADTHADALRPRHWEATAVQSMRLLCQLMFQYRHERAAGCPDTFAPAGLTRTSLVEHLLSRGFGPPCETDEAIRVFTCYSAACAPNREQVVRCMLGEPGRPDAGRVAAQACLASILAAAAGGSAIMNKESIAPPRIIVLQHAGCAANLYAMLMVQAPPQLLQFAAREGTAALMLGFLSTSSRPHDGVRRPLAAASSALTAIHEAFSMTAYCVGAEAERRAEDDLDGSCCTLLRVLSAEAADPRGVLDAGAVPGLLAMLGSAAPDRERGGAAQARPQAQLSEGRLCACDNAARALLSLSRCDASLTARAARQVLPCASSYDFLID